MSDFSRVELLEQKVEQLQEMNLNILDSLGDLTARCTKLDVDFVKFNQDVDIRLDNFGGSFYKLETFCIDKVYQMDKYLSDNFSCDSCKKNKCVRDYKGPESEVKDVDVVMDDDHHYVLRKMSQSYFSD